MKNSRLPRMAHAFGVIASVSMALLPVVLALGIFAPAALGISLWGLSGLPEQEWTVPIWLGIAVALVPFVFAMLALNGMRKLFALYRLGDPLAPQAGPLIKSIGLYLMLSAVSGLVLQPARTGLLSMMNPPGERSISIGLSSSDVGFVLVAGLLLLIGWSMTEAAKIAAENKEFI